MKRLASFLVIVALIALAYQASGCCGILNTPGTLGVAGDSGTVQADVFGTGIVTHLVPKDEKSAYKEGDYYISTSHGPDISTLSDGAWNGSWNITPISGYGAVVDPSQYTEKEQNYVANGFFGDLPIYDKIIVGAGSAIVLPDEQLGNVFHLTYLAYTRKVVSQ